ncbi:MAG: hypothetical protein MI810_16395 [Flavobacteriales bacterium]|nr:hypothetical protein [Flavobacteriales bacterium]
MKKHLTLFFLCLSFFSFAQEGFHIGVEVMPSWKLNAHRNKIIGNWSAESGYGFSLGIPIMYGKTEDVAFKTGLSYDFTSFDQLVNGVLTSSRRFNAIQLPLAANIKIKEPFYATVGGGLSYIFSARRIDLGINVPINNTLRRFQPYVSVGANLLQERDFGLFELGIQGRYFVLDIWNKNEPNVANISSHFLMLDLTMRYYL